MAETWKFRNSTLDKAIFNGVVVFNEYELPQSFAPGEIVVDVGTHIGSFAYAALSRGCDHVYGVEPDRTNCEIAAENLRQFIERGYFELVCGAVWRSDPNTDELRFDGYHHFPESYTGMEGIINTGSGSVIWGMGEPVTKLAFDELVDSVTNRGEKRIRLLKLDCEGAEWPILLTSKRLHLIDEICGEFHEIGGQFHEIGEGRAKTVPIFQEGRLADFKVERLVEYLSDAGFSVKYRRHRRPTGELEGLGVFFATRAGEPVAATSDSEQSAVATEQP